MTFVEIGKFHDSLDGLAEQFAAVDKGVSAQNERIAQLIGDFSANFGRNLPGNRSLGKIPALEAGLREVNDLMAQVIGNFKEKTLESQRQQKLRDEFSDSFLVFVYGKVKAGKSSLGNFIAGTHAGGNRSFFKFDQAGNLNESGKLEELSEDRFEVKDTEATTSIQGFLLKGMTWIDSPGLHSLSERNGKLAEAYVDAADLVLYTMSSDSPGRYSDMEELVRLACEKKKRVVVVLTKSDETCEDEIDDQLVAVLRPKPESARREQEGYVAAELRRNLAGGYQNILSEVFCISKLLAEKAVEHDDRELWAGSNLPVFYDLMTQTLLNDAIAIKRDVPLQRLRSFVDGIVGEGGTGQGGVAAPPTIKALVGRLAEQNVAVRQAIETLNDKGRLLNDWLESRIDPAIEAIFLDPALEAGAKGKAIEACVLQLISEGVTQHVEPILSDFNSDLVGRLALGLAPEEIRVSDTFKEIQIKQSHTGKGSALGGILGGVVGFFLGGQVVVGSVIGSALGGMAGDALSSSETARVRVGDDSFEVSQRLKRKCSLLARQRVAGMLDEIRENYFRPIELQTANTQASAVALKADLEKVFQLNI